MTDAEKADCKEYVAAWLRATPVLEEQRDADIRASDTVATIQSMNLLFRDAVKNFPPKPESGLVEQQRWFMKLNHK